MVTEQIEQLKQLQDILVQLLAIEQQLQSIPKDLVVKHELLERIRNRYQSNLEMKEKKKQELSRLRVELEQNETERERTEGKIEYANTQREYEALEKEIRERSDLESVIREHQEILKSEIIQLEEALEQEQELTKNQEVELAKEEKDMDVQSQKLRKEMERLEVDEMRLSKGFSIEFLFKFRRIISTMSGRGIVPLTSNVCSGCHMILPNYIVNEVRKEQEILFCPYCSKVLYYVSSDLADGEERREHVIDADLVEEFEGPLGDDINFDDLFEDEDTDSGYHEDMEDDSIEGAVDDDDNEIRGEESDDYDEHHYGDEVGEDDSLDAMENITNEKYDGDDANINFEDEEEN